MTEPSTSRLIATSLRRNLIRG
uniref:Uncharacterized protein n=1 Tax=Arundo donax TaxID=35708 RepID=A0A0A9C9P1_ARUDO